MKRYISLISGPLIFLILKNYSFQDLSNEGQAVLASTAWIALWWITEAVEIEVTSLLPIIIFPLSGALNISEVTTSYGHPYIYLFLGGFIIGLSIEKWLLHKRIAFSIIRFIGNSPKKILLGFMLATAFLSMWISNTATSIMMLPMALSVVENAKKDNLFSKNLLLGIAYAASIGGMATLIGTPPNIIFAGVLKDSLGIEMHFVNWMIFAFPLSIILLFVSWLYLSSRLKSYTIDFKLNMEKPEPLTIPQKRIAVVFILVAFLWITRSFLIVKLIPQINDTIIAIFGASILFIVPSGDSKKSKLMDWPTVKKVPWGILLIFGAGLSIAKGFSQTDLNSWLASRFLLLEFIPYLSVLLIVVASINFLTEITSNTATASMILPVLITLAGVFKINPVYLLTGAVLASSCAFMLPVATPPNAVVFSSGKIKIKEMITSGFWMNIISIIIICLLVWLLLPKLW